MMRKMFFFIIRRLCGILSLLSLSLCQNLYAANTVQIEIEGKGIKGELRQNVRFNLSLEQQKNHPRLSVGRIRRLHKQAPEEIKRALQPFGYYRVNVTSGLKRSVREKTNWIAKYVIDLGEPLKVQTVDVQIRGDGERDSVFQKLTADFPVKKGETLNHSKYEQAKALLRNIAEERGYFEAEFSKIPHTKNPQIKIDKQAYTASILMSFDTGPRYRFGDVTFKQDLFDKSVLERFLTFKPNEDFYTGAALLGFKNALVNSEYFDEVEVKSERPSPTRDKPVGDKRVPVIVTLKPRKPNKYSAGIGYGTDTGVRGDIEWKRRYVNRYGHRFSAKAQWSQIRKGVMARYSIPLGLSSDNFLAITASYKDENTDTSESEVWSLGISKHHSRILFNRKLSEVIGIEYRDERYAIGSDVGHAKLLMPNINWSYVNADNRIYTQHGQKIKLDVRGAWSRLGSNTSFLQSRLSGTFIRQPFSLTNGRIIARGDVGYSSISLLDGDFHDLPPSIRFFAGGDRSVRGYDYQALGPKNLEGQVIGGKHLLVGSLEYEHKIYGKWSLAAFYDVGNAFNDFSEPLKHGAGLGLRWQSPVGLIRIDVASALSEEGQPLRLHITIGPDL